MAAPDAVSHVRRICPGSVETPEQSEAIAEYARRLKRPETEP
jgi:hypothetical protein